MKRNDYRWLMNRAVALSLLFPSIGFSACLVPAGGDLGISIKTTQIKLGRVTKPSAGQNASIHLSADGIRNIPSNINIGQKNQQQFGDTYQAGLLKIFGAPECRFRLAVTSKSSKVNNITFIGIRGTTFSSTNYEGVFSPTGVAYIRVGATLTIDSNGSGQLLNKVGITVTAANS